MKTRSGHKLRHADRRDNRLPPVEIYSDRRVAEFLLNNSVDATDYRRACREVRKLGLDPSKIDHDPPVGVG